MQENASTLTNSCKICLALANIRPQFVSLENPDPDVLNLSKNPGHFCNSVEAQTITTVIVVLSSLSVFFSKVQITYEIKCVPLY